MADSFLTSLLELEDATVAELLERKKLRRKSDSQTTLGSVDILLYFLNK